jgi:hypothetical protein
MGGGKGKVLAVLLVGHNLTWTSLNASDFWPTLAKIQRVKCGLFSGLDALLTCRNVLKPKYTRFENQ